MVIKKAVFLVLVPVLIALGIIISQNIISFQSNHPAAPEQVAPPQQIARPEKRPVRGAEGKPIVSIFSPDDAINTGLIRSAIVIVPDQLGIINATRGSVLSVALKITHKPGPDPLPSVTVIATGADAGLFILNNLVRFEPASVTLAPGETKTIQLLFTIPQNLPDEMRALVINPRFTSHEPKVGYFHRGADVHVVG